MWPIRNARSLLRRWIGRIREDVDDVGARFALVDALAAGVVGAHAPPVAQPLFDGHFEAVVMPRAAGRLGHRSEILSFSGIRQRELPARDQIRRRTIRA